MLRDLLSKLKSDKFVSVLLFLIVSFVFFYGIIRAADGIIISNDRGTILFPSGSTPASNGEVGYNGTNFLLRTGGNNAAISGLGPLDATGNPGGGHGKYKNLVVQFATTSTVSITADSLDVYNSNNQIVTLYNVSLVPSTASSGALGLDTGSVAVDKNFALWVLVKSDGSANTAVYSLSFTSPALPSGYTNAYKFRVGSCFTAHTSTAILPFQQTNDVFAFMNQVTGLTTADGNKILNSGSATTYAAVSVAPRVPVTSRLMRTRIVMVASNSVGGVQVDFRPTGSSSDAIEMYNDTSVNQEISWYLDIPINSSQSIDYHAGTSSQRVYIEVHGFYDNL